MKQFPVAIVGLSKLFSEGVAALLRRTRFAVITTSETLDEALPNFAIERPCLLICAIATSHTVAFQTVAAQIEQLSGHRAELDDVRIVLLCNQLGAEDLREAAMAGVQGVLSFDISSDVLQRSLELIMLGQQLFPGLSDLPKVRPLAALIPFSRPVLTSVISPPNNLPLVKNLFEQPHGTGPQRSMALSDRERQILRCLVDGAANKTIARDLQITEATVKVHIKGLLRKIHVANRTQAAVWGMNNGTMLDAPRASHDHGTSARLAAF